MNPCSPTPGSGTCGASTRGRSSRRSTPTPSTSIRSPTCDMADVREQPAALAPDDTARVTEFARACKAAARAVILYPPGHPAIAATVGRIVHVTSAAKLSAPITFTVLPDGLLLDGRAPARPDPAIGELAELLHAHLIGEITVRPGGDANA